MSKSKQELKGAVGLGFSEAVNILFSESPKSLKFAVKNLHIKKFYEEHIEPLLAKSITGKIRRQVQDTVNEYRYKVERDINKEYMSMLGKGTFWKKFELSGAAKKAIAAEVKSQFYSEFSDYVAEETKKAKEEARVEFEEKEKEKKLKEDIQRVIEQRIIELYKNKTVVKLEEVISTLKKDQ